MNDLRLLLPSKAKAELYEEVRKRLSESMHFNIYGELKTYVFLEIRKDLERDFKYLEELAGFGELYREVFDLALKELG